MKTLSRALIHGPDTSSFVLGFLTHLESVRSSINIQKTLAKQTVEDIEQERKIRFGQILTDVAGESEKGIHHEPFPFVDTGDCSFYREAMEEPCDFDVVTVYAQVVTSLNEADEAVMPSHNVSHNISVSRNLGMSPDEVQDFLQLNIYGDPPQPGQSVVNESQRFLEECKAFNDELRETLNHLGIPSKLRLWNGL